MKNRFLFIVLAAFTLTVMSSCSNNSSNAADAVLENIHNRKSVRQFTSEPVSEKDVETVLKAAMAAPTAVNFQP